MIMEITYNAASVCCSVWTIPYSGNVRYKQSMWVAEYNSEGARLAIIKLRCYRLWVSEIHELLDWDLSLRISQLLRNFYKQWNKSITVLTINKE